MTGVWAGPRSGECWCLSTLGAQLQDDVCYWVDTYYLVHSKHFVREH